MDKGNFILCCKETDFCLDVPECNASIGKPVILYPYKHGGDNQLWQFKHGKVITVLDADICLGVYGHPSSGSEIVLINKNADKLKWRFDGEYVCCSEYYLTSKDNKLLLDISKPDNVGQKWYFGSPPAPAKPATSCHLTYGLIQQEEIESLWTLECTVNVKETTDNTYFAVVGWGPGGYSGIQQLNDGKRKAIFSMWRKDCNDVELVECGKGVTVSVFGGEGTGLKSMTDFDWKTNESITFRIKGEKNKDTWIISCWIEVLGQATIFMASFKGHYALPLNTCGFYSFIEDFNRGSCTNGYLTRRSACFLNPKINGRLLGYADLTKVERGSDAFACHKVFARCEGRSCILMQTGGCDDISEDICSNNSRLTFLKE